MKPTSGIIHNSVSNNRPSSLQYNKMADQYGNNTRSLRSSPATLTKENVPSNQLTGGYQQDSNKKCSSLKKRKASGDLQRDSREDTENWQELYKALEAERVTKAESLLYAYRQESEERERLMRSYNQELEQDNKRLKSEASNLANQKEEIHTLQQEVQDLKATVAKQKAVLRIYEAFTGATFSNLPVYDTNQCDYQKNDSDALACDCTVANSDTKIATTFHLSTVEMPSTQQQQEQSDRSDGEVPAPILKYTPLENSKPLPPFLQEEIEFEKSQLPALLQNILRGIFPEED